jgi:hypothetical protein
MCDHQHATAARYHAIDEFGGDDRLARSGGSDDERPRRRAEQALDTVDSVELVGAKGGYDALQ